MVVGRGFSRDISASLAGAFKPLTPIRTANTDRSPPTAAELHPPPSCDAASSSAGTPACALFARRKKTAPFSPVDNNLWGSSFGGRAL